MKKYLSLMDKLGIYSDPRFGKAATKMLKHPERIVWKDIPYTTWEDFCTEEIEDGFQNEKENI